ncbi:MAG: hypothetical protein LBK66_09115 [Spirochaetaceae bacterium]|nr:hypothetical protein [Spirochaetaceae bacterium]
MKPQTILRDTSSNDIGKEYAKTEPDMTYIYFEQVLDSHRYRYYEAARFTKLPTRSL